MRYKVGQRVKVIARKLGHDYDIGKNYTITRAVAGHMYVLDGGDTVCIDEELCIDFNEYLKLV